eukprot:1560842-Amphidinium_carterae.1
MQDRVAVQHMAALLEFAKSECQVTLECCRRANAFHPMQDTLSRTRLSCTMAAGSPAVWTPCALVARCPAYRAAVSCCSRGTARGGQAAAKVLMASATSAVRGSGLVTNTQGSSWCT